MYFSKKQLSWINVKFSYAQQTRANMQQSGKEKGNKLLCQKFCSLYPVSRFFNTATDYYRT